MELHKTAPQGSDLFRENIKARPDSAQAASIGETRLKQL
jgi:hypothetical protein